MTGSITWTSFPTFKSWRHRRCLLRHIFIGDPYSWSLIILGMMDLAREGSGWWIYWSTGERSHHVTRQPKSPLYSRRMQSYNQLEEKNTVADKNHAKGIRRKNTSEKEGLKKWQMLRPVLAQPGSPLSLLSLALPSCLMWVQFKRCFLGAELSVTVWFQAVPPLWLKRKGKVFTWSVYE